MNGSRCIIQELAVKRKRNPSLVRLVVILLSLAMLSACSSFRFPGVHRITVQQGNVITQQMIDKLRPGMTKSQVRFVLGNPVVDDSLNVERWDYVYTIQLAGGPILKKYLSVFFVENRLSHFQGDYVPSEEFERMNAAAG